MDAEKESYATECTLIALLL